MNHSGLTLFERLMGVYYRRLFSPLFARVLRARGIRVGQRVIFYGKPSITLARGSALSIGDGCVLCSRAAYTALGIHHPVSLKTLTASAKLTIGSLVGMSGGSVCAATSVSIGDQCLLGANVAIADTDFHPIAAQGRRTAPLSAARSSPVVLHGNVFVGTGAVILKGVTVGADTVIGAMSLVLSDVPAGVVAAGNPCKPVRPL